MTRLTLFATGCAVGFAVGTAATLAARPDVPAAPLRPVTVTLHRFDVKSGEQPRLAEWIGFLRAHHREAVATLGRERTYFEAMFTGAGEPDRLYWLTVNGAGGATVNSSTLDLDRRHMAYMDAVLAPGSHLRFETRNVLAPDFVVAAVRAEQRREGR